MDASEMPSGLFDELNRLRQSALAELASYGRLTFYPCGLTAHKWPPEHLRHLPAIQVQAEPVASHDRCTWLWCRDADELHLALGIALELVNHGTAFAPLSVLERLAGHQIGPDHMVVARIAAE